MSNSELRLVLWFVANAVMVTLGIVYRFPPAFVAGGAALVGSGYVIAKRKR